MHRDRAAIDLADWKVQRNTLPVFLELRAGITPVALGVPSAWHPRVLPC